MNLNKISEMKIYLKNELENLELANTTLEREIKDNDLKIEAIKSIIGLSNDVSGKILEIIEKIGGKTDEKNN